MHRLAAVPGLPEGPGADGQIPYVEQPPAPVLLLSSADTDLRAINALLQRQPERLGTDLRALNLAALAHPAVIDHYVARTLEPPPTRLVVVRLLGGRGHWSYGIERLRAWAKTKNLKLSPTAQIARYDDPFTLPWNRRNEILIDLMP